VEHGLGQIRQAVLTHYVLLIAGYLLQALGGLLWVIAKDVVRYRPFVIAATAIFLVGAPAFYLINAVAGMPTWCGITDFVLCFILGGVLLAFCLWPTSNEPVAYFALDRMPRSAVGRMPQFGLPWRAPRHRSACRWSRHEVAFGTAWLDWFPDQVLRVAAGIPRKHASGGLGRVATTARVVWSLPDNVANLVASNWERARIGGQGQIN
jgi:hypothetical protein